MHLFVRFHHLFYHLYFFFIYLLVKWYIYKSYHFICFKDEVVINYNKLHADPQQGKSLDIILKKVKHRLVENMSSSTADALGLSRAILCNDTLVKKLQELQDTEIMYRGLVDHCKRVLQVRLLYLQIFNSIFSCKQAHIELQQAVKAMGDVFAGLAVREPQPRASEAFRLFGEQHRSMEKIGNQVIQKIKPVRKI